MLNGNKEPGAIMEKTALMQCDDRENPPDGESDDIQEVLKLAAAFHREQYERYNRYKRGQHTKDTGCVRAEFIVEPDLDEALRVGVFREPKTFAAIVRFSNAADHAQPDRTPDARGMAIKLFDVDGTKSLPTDELQPGQNRVQDFVMVNHPSFPFANVRQYKTFFQLKKYLGSKLARPLFFLFHWRQANIAKQTLNQPVANPVDIQYWSMSPYGWGTRAMKFSAQPQVPEMGRSPQTSQLSTDNSLFSALAERVSQGDVYFDFLVQFHPEPGNTQWVEDASQTWTSAFHKVATLRIPQQDLTSPEMEEFHRHCEQLPFNPWHALVEHKPLGGINRVRRAVYLASSRRRLSDSGS
jgi:hypothetical protein